MSRSVRRMLLRLIGLAGGVALLASPVCAQRSPSSARLSPSTAPAIPMLIPPIPEATGNSDTALGPYDTSASPRGPAVAPPDATLSSTAIPGDNQEDLDALREYYRQFPLRRRQQSDQQRKLEAQSDWLLQPLPDGRIFPSYLAGQREPRMAGQVVHDRQLGAVLNGTLGGRFGLIRYGNRDSLLPEGVQLDVEGAAFPRIAIEDDHTFTSSDFRAGIPLVFRRGPLELKFAYYHYCSHLGDSWSVMHPEFPATPYTRDALVWAVGFRPLPDLRFYAEADWAFYDYGATRPWEFQFGADYSPVFVTWFRGAPFLAVNVHLREDVDYSGLFTLQAGWQWRGDCGQLLRTGLAYSNGLSDHGQFYNRFEEQIGVGLWYDF